MLHAAADVVVVVDDNDEEEVWLVDVEVGFGKVDEVVGLVKVAKVEDVVGVAFVDVLDDVGLFAEVDVGATVVTTARVCTVGKMEVEDLLLRLLEIEELDLIDVIEVEVVRANDDVLVRVGLLDEVEDRAFELLEDFTNTFAVWKTGRCATAVVGVLLVVIKTGR